MLVGVLRPVILLPEAPLNAAGLKLALTHEYTHYRCRDLWVKLFLLLAACIQWFNPLGWLLRALNYELSHEFARQAKQTAQEQPLHPPPAGLAPTPPPSLGLAEVLPVQLSPRDREILLLFYEEGLSYQEIAQRLGVPVSTCGTWLSRARKHCRAYLSHSPGFPD